jgi:ribA/ribD-fused uncharacterized protein
MMAKAKIYSYNCRGKPIFIKAYSWAQIAKWDDYSISTVRKWGGIVGPDCEHEMIVDLTVPEAQWPKAVGTGKNLRFERTDPIDSFTGCYAFLSNFYRSPMMINRRLYGTVEHYFQSQKTTDAGWQKRIQMAKSPGVAKSLGRACPLREDWERVKEGVMFFGLQEKFRTPYLRHMLLETGDRELIEGNSWHDTYWGVCEGEGQNKLGKLLMRLRDELRERKVTL